MGILDRTKRVDLGGGEWADIRPLSVAEGRALDVKARKVRPEDGESETEAQIYFRLAVARERIVAWSDEAPVTPKNTARLSIELNERIWNALINEDDELPLPTGSPSTVTSEESAEE